MRLERVFYPRERLVREWTSVRRVARPAAIALKGMLEARGIVVTGKARAEHRISNDAAGFVAQMKDVGREQDFLKGDAMHVTCLPSPTSTPGTLEKILASHRSPVLVEDVTVTNKVSQNLHAELIQRLLGRIMIDTSRVDASQAGVEVRGPEAGSIAAGTRVVRQFLLTAGVPADDFFFYDGSGMSANDLITPRAYTTLLTYAAKQGWGAAWKATFPIAGVDGTLSGRFKASPLKGRLFAKTGTLNEVNALSGYLEAKSGRTLAFSILVNGHLPGSDVEIHAMDKICEVIAAAE